MAKYNGATRGRLAQLLTPQEQMIVDSFQSEVYIQGKVDVQHEPIYDTILIAQAAQLNENTAALFTNVGPASGKTLGQTNMTQQRRLPSLESFSIMGIRLFWNENAALADLLNITGDLGGNTQAFELYLGKKPYNTGPLWYYAAGGGIVNYNPVAAADLLLNGNPDRNGMHKLAIPLVIENMGEFWATLKGTQYQIAGATGFQLMCVLDGLHARGVQ